MVLVVRSGVGRCNWFFRGGAAVALPSLASAHSVYAKGSGASIGVRRQPGALCSTSTGRQS